MSQRFYYICNVFEDSVRTQRSVTTDSPAANGKVSLLCQAVRSAGGDARIISLGRGRSVGTLRRFPATAGSIRAVPIEYVAYWDVPVLTHLVTLVSLCVAVLRLTDRNSVLIFYNCQIHYLLALIAGRLSGRKCFLDIEDGFRRDDRTLRGRLTAALTGIFNLCCSGGAMLASAALKEQTPASHTYVCYGVSQTQPHKKTWTAQPLQVLLGGSLLKDTGADLFLEALRLLQVQSPAVLQQLRFVVTGFGASAGQLQQAAQAEMKEFLEFRGNVSSGEYRQILQDSHLGLCLKLPSSSMGATTFPSKVVELASHGLLVVSTRVSDVPLVLDNSSAFLLGEATAQALADALREIAGNPGQSGSTALQGQQKIAALLSEETVGAGLLQFWQGH